MYLYYIYVEIHLFVPGKGLAHSVSLDVEHEEDTWKTTLTFVKGLSIGDRPQHLLMLKTRIPGDNMNTCKGFLYYAVRGRLQHRLMLITRICGDDINVS